MPLKRAMGVLSVLVAVTSCGRPDEPQTNGEEIAETLEHTADSLASETGRFAQDARSELESIGEVMRAGWDSLSEEARVRWAEVHRGASEASAALEEQARSTATAGEVQAVELDATVAEKRRELERWMVEARLTAADTREDFGREISEQLSSFDAALGQIETKLDTSVEVAQAEGREELADLRESWTELEVEAQRLGDRAEDEFAMVRADLARTAAELGYEIDSLGAKLGIDTVSD